VHHSSGDLDILGIERDSPKCHVACLLWSLRLPSCPGRWGGGGLERAGAESPLNDKIWNKLEKKEGVKWHRCKVTKKNRHRRHFCDGVFIFVSKANNSRRVLVSVSVLRRGRASVQSTGVWCIVEWKTGGNKRVCRKNHF